MALLPYDRVDGTALTEHVLCCSDPEVKNVAKEPPGPGSILDRWRYPKRQDDAPVPLPGQTLGWEQEVQPGDVGFFPAYRPDVCQDLRRVQLAQIPSTLLPLWILRLVLGKTLAVDSGWTTDLECRREGEDGR